MSTLLELRTNVHLQMDIDADDISDALINDYIREGFDRTMAAEYRWPSFETTWAATLPASSTSFTMPSTPSEPAFIESLIEDVSGQRLKQVGQSAAEEVYSEATGTGLDADLFSVWGDTVTVWPQQSNAGSVAYTIRGYRKPVWSGADGTELEGDARLHLPIFHYAVSLAYAQFEDPELETQYLRRWSNGIEAVRKDAMRPQHHRPLVLNSGLAGLKRDAGRNQLNWNP